MPPAKRFTVALTIRLTEELQARSDCVRKPGESESELARVALEREIARRERAQARERG